MDLELDLEVLAAFEFLDSFEIFRIFAFEMGWMGEESVLECFAKEKRGEIYPEASLSSSSTRGDFIT